MRVEYRGELGAAGIASSVGGGGAGDEAGDGAGGVSIKSDVGASTLAANATADDNGAVPSTTTATSDDATHLLTLAGRVESMSLVLLLCAVSTLRDQIVASGNRSATDDDDARRGTR